MLIPIALHIYIYIYIHKYLLLLSALRLLFQLARTLAGKFSQTEENFNIQYIHYLQPREETPFERLQRSDENFRTLWIV